MTNTRLTEIKTDVSGAGVLNKIRSKDNNFCIFHQNIQSISSKIGEIEVHIEEHKEIIPILCFTEHWQTSNNMEYIKIKSYTLASHWSRSNMKHGGSCIYVKNGMTFKELENLKQLSIDGLFECSAIETKNIVVICIYRSPSNSADVTIFFSRLLEMLDRLGQKLYTRTIAICGDFNIDIILKNRTSIAFLDILGSHGFKQTIFEPTHVTNTTKTLIDNIFTNNLDEIKGSVIINAISDHYAQKVSLPINFKTTVYDKIKIRNYSKAKMTAFKNELKKMYWEDIKNETEVNKAYNSFVSTLTHLSNRIFTYKTITNKPTDNKWVTEDIKLYCRTKRSMLLQKIRGEISSETYKNYSKRLKKTITTAKKSYYENFIINSKNKCKATWKIISDKVNKDANKIDLQTTFNNKSLQDVLNDFNYYFINACPDLGSNANLEHIQRNNCSLFLGPSDPHEIYRVILQLNNTTSVGIDEIPIKILKFVAEEIAEPLAYIINLSLTGGIYPNALKTSLVHPIYKKGDRSIFDNYRPISIQSNLSKIFEKVIGARISNFIDSKYILTDKQNGFRKRKTTTRAIYQLVSEVLLSLNEKYVTTAMLLDLSKAFDSVDHTILLDKLEMYGIRGVSNNLIKSFLTERRQAIVYKDNKTKKTIMSQFLPTNRGVPQGTVLGPMMFILYTSDIVHSIDDEMVLYADDTSITFKERNTDQIIQKMQNSFSQLTHWFTANNLKLNINKTKIIKFSYPLIDEDPLTLHINNFTIKTVESANLLGVELDRRLDWRSHVDKIGKKISSFAYALKVLSCTVSQMASRTAYMAYIQSTISYGIILWGNSVDVERIFILQKRCIRNIYGIQPRNSCRPIFMRQGILTFYGIYIIEAIKFVIDNKLLFKQWERKHTYHTRNKDDLCPMQTSLSYIQNNAHHTIIKIYNKIPLTLRNLNKVAMIKLLKKHLTEKAYYSLEEFYNDNICIQ